MPITIKSTELKYKNPSTGQYQGVDAVAEMTTSEQCALIEAKGAEVIESIPSDYTTLSTKVGSSTLDTTAQNLSDAINEHESDVSALNGAIDALETTVGGTVGIGAEAGLIRKSCFFNATANISLGSTGVTIEQYARGEIISADGNTGCIIAVGYGSKAYFAFFESGIIRTAKIYTTDSPTFTGTPTAPTQNAQDSSTKIATTAFVQGHVSDLNTAITSLGSDDIANDSTNVSGLKVTNALDTLNGAINALETTVGGTVGIGTEAGLIRKSCFFNATANIPLGSTGITIEAYARGVVISADGETGSIVAVGYPGRIYTAFFANGVIQRAQINQTESPAFSGTPTAPTAASGTNTTQIATTAFVQNALDYTVTNVPLTNKYGGATLYKTGHICVIQSSQDFDSVAEGLNVIGQLPNGYFPTTNVRTNITNIASGLNFVDISTSGQIALYSDQASAGARNGSFWAMWITA